MGAGSRGCAKAPSWRRRGCAGCAGTGGEGRDGTVEGGRFADALLRLREELEGDVCGEVRRGCNSVRRFRSEQGLSISHFTRLPLRAILHWRRRRHPRQGYQRHAVVPSRVTVEKSFSMKSSILDVYCIVLLYRVTVLYRSSPVVYPTCFDTPAYICSVNDPKLNASQATVTKLLSVSPQPEILEKWRQSQRSSQSRFPQPPRWAPPGIRQHHQYR